MTRGHRKDESVQGQLNFNGGQAPKSTSSAHHPQPPEPENAKLNKDLCRLVDDDANYDRVVYLVEHGASPDALSHFKKPAVNIAAAHGAVKNLDYLLLKGADQTKVDDISGEAALHAAIGGGQLQAVKRLLAQKELFPQAPGEVNMDLVVALQKAAKTWEILEGGVGLDIAVELLKAGAIPHIQNRNELDSDVFATKARAHHGNKMTEEQKIYSSALISVLRADAPTHEALAEQWDKLAKKAHEAADALGKPRGLGGVKLPTPSYPQR